MELSPWIFGHAGFLLDTCPLGIILEVSKDAVFLSTLCCSLSNFWLWASIVQSFHEQARTPKRGRPVKLMERDNLQEVADTTGRKRHGTGKQEPSGYIRHQL